MSRKLKPFDPNAKCPKCGHDVITSLYQKAGEGFFLEDMARADDERIDRTCQRCHYDWSEAPLARATPRAMETSK